MFWIHVIVMELIHLAYLGVQYVVAMSSFRVAIHESIRRSLTQYLFLELLFISIKVTSILVLVKMKE